MYGKTTLFHELEDLVKSNPKNFVRMLKSVGFKHRCPNRQHLRDFVMEMTPMLVDTSSFKYKWKTRVYWVLNSIKSWNDDRVRCIVCKHPFIDVDVKSVAHGYLKKTCCKECERALAKQSCKQHMQKTYGIDNAFQVKSVLDKLKAQKDSMQAHREMTRRRNGTFNVSKQEDEVYKMLCSKFGEEDIVRQYRSEKYPFACDFYVKSHDLYIECNFSWTHGGHWFDASNEEDQKTLQLWKGKGTKYYENAIETWTVRDVKKRHCAKQNSLNYLVFWRLEDVVL